MFCTQCGNEVQQHARFCSKCGQETTASAAASASATASASAAAPAAPTQWTKAGQRNMDTHVNILGWLLVGSGILTAIGGMIVLIVGAVVRKMPIPAGHDFPGVFFASGIVTIVGMGILALAAATAAAGVGLLQYRDWARVFAIVVAVLLVFHFPIGTAIAIYAFWVLFSEEGQKYYKSRSESTMTVSGR